MLLEQVHEGMTVLDSEGEEFGSVELVRMADEDAVTEREPAETEAPPMPMPSPGFIPGASGAGAPGGAGPMGAGVPPVATGIGEEPDVPGEIARRLRRTGYFKVDTKGLFRRDVYVSATEIDAVTDDAVTLAVPKNELTKQG